jgi:hypothetical protein
VIYLRIACVENNGDRGRRERVKKEQYTVMLLDTCINLQARRAINLHRWNGKARTRDAPSGGPIQAKVIRSTHEKDVSVTSC